MRASELRDRRGIVTSGLERSLGHPGLGHLAGFTLSGLRQRPSGIGISGDTGVRDASATNIRRGR